MTKTFRTEDTNPAKSGIVLAKNAEEMWKGKGQKNFALMKLKGKW